MSARRVCANDGCERAVVGRGLCRMHYLQQWRAGTVAEQPLRQREQHECPTDELGHEHTVEGCWGQHGCRCTRCVHERRMERQRRRNRLRAYGREEQIGPERVPAEPVRAHLLDLIGQGFGLERIADAAGVPRHVLMDLKFGRRGQRTSAASRVVDEVRREYAHAMLAIAAEDIDPAAVPSTGTARRLQALCAIGWTQSELAEIAGMDRTNFWSLTYGRGERVAAATAEKVQAIFAERWNQPRFGARADYARRIAARNEWQPPLAWDDIDLDAEPAIADDVEIEAVDWAAVEQCIAGLAVALSADERIEVIRTMHERGEADADIADRLGVKKNAVQQARRRHQIGTDDAEMAA